MLDVHIFGFTARFLMRVSTALVFVASGIQSAGSCSCLLLLQLCVIAELVRRTAS